MAVRTITPPTELAVTLADFQQHLWNIYDGHDAEGELTAFLAAAVAAGETLCGRKFVRREMQLDAFGTGMWLFLPFGDFVAVTAWEHDDADGRTTAGDPAVLRARHIGMTGFVEVWIPETAGAQSVRVSWRCGMADNAAALPADLRMGIKQIAAHYYNNRATAAQEGEVGRVSYLPEMGRMLLHPYRFNFMPDAGGSQ